MFLQEYTPEEDSTRKLIEAHFRGKPMDINFDKDKGEIVITYKNLNKEPTLMQLLVCRQMINIFMRYVSIISFCFSSVAPIFFTNKINRMLLEYLYSDDLVGPAIMSVSLLSCICLLANILLLHQLKSKKMMLTAFSAINYCLLLLLTFFSETLMGMLMMATISIFLYVYMQVLISYLLSISASQTHQLNYMYPLIYSSHIIGNLIKIFIIDSNSDTFQSTVFVMLVIQGLGFLFIGGVNIKKLRQACIDYSAFVEKQQKKSTYSQYTRL